MGVRPPVPFSRLLVLGRLNEKVKADESGRFTVVVDMDEVKSIPLGEGPIREPGRAEANLVWLVVGLC